MPFLELSYWTSLLPPPGLHPVFFWILIAVFGLFVLDGIIAHVLAKKWPHKAFWAKAAPKFGNLQITIGVLGLMHVWIAYEQVYFLGARFWLIVLLLAWLIWLGRILWYVFKKLPKEREAYEEKRRIEKYLPGKKRKG